MTKPIPFIVLGILLASTLAPAMPFVTDLGTLGGASSTADAINDQGQVTGQAYTQAPSEPHAYLWGEGGMVDLGTLGGYESFGHSINDFSQVVGGASIGNGDLRAFLYDDHGKTDLGTLGGRHSYATAINNSGVVVGSSDLNSLETRAFYWTLGGGMVALPTLGGVGGAASGINNLNEISGTARTATGEEHAFLWSGGSMLDLGSLGFSGSQVGSWTGSVGADVNDFSQVVGRADLLDGSTTSFLYSDGVMYNIGMPSKNWSMATAINNSGQVVGYSIHDGTSRPFIFEDGRWADLNALVDPSLGWLLLDAYDINNRGQIVGTGVLNGEHHGYILNLDGGSSLPEGPVEPPSAVPVPGTMSLLATGLLYVAGATRKLRPRSPTETRAVR